MIQADTTNNTRRRDFLALTDVTLKSRPVGARRRVYPLSPHYPLSPQLWD